MPRERFGMAAGAIALGTGFFSPALAPTVHYPREAVVTVADSNNLDGTDPGELIVTINRQGGLDDTSTTQSIVIPVQGILTVTAPSEQVQALDLSSNSNSEVTLKIGFVGQKEVTATGPLDASVVLVNSHWKALRPVKPLTAPGTSSTSTTTSSQVNES
jgi:hypothetical protein